MKQFKFLSLPLLAMMSFFFVSCGDGAETTADEASGDTTVTTTTDAATDAETTSGTLMLVRHKVKDYAKWKPVYDAHDSARLAYGIHNFVIARGVDDPDMIFIATKVDDVEKAKAFGKSESLKNAMEAGGVVGEPKVMLATVPFLKTTPNQDIRAISFFTVKDYDAWKTSFESGKQFRLDNGLDDRAYGHDVDDNHKVTYVGTVSDSAKVRAYHKSDSLKQRLKEAGVEGTVDRFWYRVVATY